MKRILPLLFLLVAVASGQTAKTRSTLYTQIDTDLPSGAGLTAAQLRAVFDDVLASAYVPLTDGTPLLASAIGSTLQAHSAALDTIAANGSAFYLARGNHTGTQLAATISDFISAATAAAPVQTVAGRAGAVVLTKSDVGLANVDNTADAAKPVSTAQAAAIAVVQDDVNAHEALTNNPHAVTKAQVGLANVDNTSDAAKPVSTATQTALDLKASLAALAAVNASGVNTDGILEWSQLVGVPAGFADGSDDGSGGGSGTVTSFSAGNMAPVFTTEVANATSTPALTFNLSTQVANRVLAGPATGVDAAPTFRALVAADVPDLSATYATAAQGALADTATQPGDNISTLNNDAGFTSNAGTVTSVAISGSDGIEIDSGSPITSSGTIALGVNASTLKTHLSLGNVENTALSTWAGSTAITTLGTIATGTVPVARVSGLGTLATQNGTFSGTSSGTNTGDQTTITGNAGTATALQTARTINGVSFDGTANITLTTWSALSGTTPALTFTAGAKAHTHTLSGNTTYSASGYAQGYRITLYITADASLRTLAFPSWTWLEGAPTEIAAGKVMQIDLTCTGSTAASVFAVYGVQQ